MSKYDINIDTDSIEPELNQIVAAMERITSKAVALRSALNVASSGFQSKNLAKAEAAINSTISTMNNAVDGFRKATEYANSVASVAEYYLSLKY